MATNTLSKEEYPHLYAVLEDYAREVRNRYQDALISKGKIASGNLLNTAEYRIEDIAGNILVSLDLASYWKYVEHGQAPEGRYPQHRPPTSAIRKWIDDKGITPYADADGRVPSKDSLAYLIARSIGENGIAPTDALTGVLSDLAPNWEDKIAEAVAEDIGDIIALTFADTSYQEGIS